MALRFSELVPTYRKGTDNGLDHQMVGISGEKVFNNGGDRLLSAPPEQAAEAAGAQAEATAAPESPERPE